jgi:hypothetical protein
VLVESGAAKLSVEQVVESKISVSNTFKRFQSNGNKRLNIDYNHE